MDDTFYESMKITKVFIQIPGHDKCPRFKGIEIPKKNDEFIFDDVKYYVSQRIFKPQEKSLMIVLEIK